MAPRRAAVRARAEQERRRPPALEPVPGVAKRRARERRRRGRRKATTTARIAASTVMAVPCKARVPRCNSEWVRWAVTKYAAVFVSTVFMVARSYGMNRRFALMSRVNFYYSMSLINLIHDLH
jgi:hypothetical protein